MTGEPPCGARAGVAGQDAGVAVGLAWPLAGLGARGRRPPRVGPAALGRARAARAAAESVGGGSRERGAPPAAALPAPHAVGQAHRNLAAVSAVYLEHWFGG